VRKLPANGTCAPYHQSLRQLPNSPLHPKLSGYAGPGPLLSGSLIKQLSWEI